MAQAVAGELSGQLLRDLTAPGERCPKVKRRLSVARPDVCIAWDTAADNTRVIFSLVGLEYP